MGSGAFPTLGNGQSWRWRCSERPDPGNLSATEWVRTGDSLLDADTGGLYEVMTDVQEPDKEEDTGGDGENDELDARVMTIARGADGARHRPFREAGRRHADGDPVGRLAHRRPANCSLVLEVHP